jgi:ATP-dependent Clp protease ATP-binding subunit ClpC
MSPRTHKNVLDAEGRNLTAAADRGVLPETDCRDALVARVTSALSAGRSVLLVGGGGVGKSAVVRAVAGAMADHSRDVLELSTTTILSGTKYLGEWQSKVLRIAETAQKSETILYLSDVWNRPQAGRSSSSDTNLLDALKPSVSAGLVLLGEATPEQHRQMQRVPGFADLFEAVTVPPLEPQEADRCVQLAAERAGLSLDDETRRALVKLTTRFLPARPQPAPALDLLARLADGAPTGQGAGRPVGVEDIEEVLSRATGLPRFVVSPRQGVAARDVRAWFAERIVGQREAIEAVLEVVALFKAGLHDPSRPIGTLLFVGPTGVGKTEVARALATWLFGSPSRLLRFDLSEFKDFHSFEQLLGDPRDPTKPARLVDPVRAQPFQVVLLDELEKAHANVWDLLLPLLDEGRMTPPGGAPVSFRSTIVIATSNVGAERAEKGVGFGASDGQARRSRTLSSLEQTFRPEFLNRFGHVVVFHSLSEDQAREIARHEIRRILEREGITSRNLVVEVDDAALELLVQRGFDPRYGARALKRVLQRQLVLPLAMTLMESPIAPGAILRVAAVDSRIRVRVVDTPESRAALRERAPIVLDDGRRVDPEHVPEVVSAVGEHLDELIDAVDVAGLHARRTTLEETRDTTAFWQDPEAAGRVLRDLDATSHALNRVERLMERQRELTERVDQARSREARERAAAAAGRLRRAVEHAWRELVVLGEDGRWDALVELRPLGGDRPAMGRDALVDAYLGWARGRKHEVVWLREPRTDDEPAMFAIQGPYAAGLLAGEGGLHRFRDGEHQSVIRVRVAAWTDASGTPNFGPHQALKQHGAYGGRLRSRLEAGELVLQNSLPLGRNRELAAELIGAWRAAPPPTDDIVRRYDLARPLLRDVATGFSSGRPDALSPASLHELLRARVDSGSNGRA